ncbi:MAG: TldD/PmbA family protein [Deltaproteobacteria bacterium]|nr:MAG: TldD/PmbA family protein [Deltaproteobacteria bacterium]
MSDLGADPQALLAYVLETAKQAGATAADGLFITGRSASVRVRLGETEKVSQARDKGVGVRVFVGNRSATTSTSDLSEAAITALIQRTVAAARVTAEDPFSGLPDAALFDEPLTDLALDLYDDDLVGFDAERAIALARETEAISLAQDPRLKNSEGAEMSWGHSALHFANSLGVYRTRRSSSVSLWTTPVAEDGDEKQRDYWWTSARHLEDLGSDAAEAVGREAARRTLRRLGAKKPATCQVPVIFEAPIASSLLGSLAGAISGSALYKDASYLCDKLGETLAPSFVNVVDNPHIPRGPGSRTFDAEGLATRPTRIIEGGVLASYLLDTYTGKKLGLASTRGARRGLASTPSPGASNFWMDNGALSFEELIGGVKQGLLVTETSGFGVNTVTGDYSQGVVGMWIEDGALAYPVHEATIASTLPRMWASIDALANDRDPRRGTSAPSLRIAQMTVAGT